VTVTLFTVCFDFYWVGSHYKSEEGQTLMYVTCVNVVELQGISVYVVVLYFQTCHSCKVQRIWWSKFHSVTVITFLVPFDNSWTKLMF